MKIQYKTVASLHLTHQKINCNIDLKWIFSTGCKFVDVLYSFTYL